MAQMSVPAEPSYRTTSYNGLKGADFSNDPSLVARNHSPDLLNMISDNGGSPIKRKGWEVTDIATDEEMLNIWHFQMFGKLWHLACCRSDSTHIKLYEIDSDGQLGTALATITFGTTPCGFFFNSADETKTGFYILAGNIYKVRPASSSSMALSYYSGMTATVPTIMEHKKYDGSGGISTQGINMLTRTVTVSMWDSRTGEIAPRNIEVFSKVSNLRIDSTKPVKVEVLDPTGDWITVPDEDVVIIPDTVPNRRIQIWGLNVGGNDGDPDTIDVVTGSETVDNIKITVSLQGNTGLDKIGKCTCSTIFSQMTEGQVFISGNPTYPQYVWYSEIADPLYFPDTNYLFVGGAGTQVKGMMPFGSQIAVFKEPSTTESTIFLINYTQATDQIIQVDGTSYTQTRDVYQVKHGFAGVGSLTADAVFSLGDEPLFLSQHGIMGMVASAINSSNSVKSRSDFLNPRLLEETDLSNAIATVHKNYYILVVNGHAYILDMRQKSSDYKGNTSYLYESYYWDNIPASCISSDGETLWFGTADGRVCRFKNSGRMKDYSDNTRYGDDPIRVYVKRGETALSSTWFVNSGNEAITPDEDEKYIIMGEVYVDDGEIIVDPEYDDGTYQKYDVFSYTGSVYQSEYTVAPVEAVWSTPLDNDGATNYFKTLQKKGSGCTLYPFTRSSVDAYLEKDGNAEVYIGSMTIDIDNWEDIDFSRFTFVANKAPRDLFFRKKMKKYKRLKIILKNNQLDEGFGVQEIFKTYLFTRYAK